VRGGWAVDVGELWSMAGGGPQDVDFVETYDGYPVIVMMQLEDLGFCRKGEAAEVVRAHTLANDGSVPPHNCRGARPGGPGRAGAAGGYWGLVEAIRRLTDASLGTQVADASIGLVSGFGMINYDRGLASAAAILARVA